jgi:serine protease Do
MGNSGGPLFNTGGRVIGINTAIASPTGGSVGIGFSIPASVAQDVIKQLKDHGRTRRGWLGVGIQTITKQIAESVDLKTTHGALVVKVYPNSPADKASIKRGDIILKFNSQSIKESRRLPKMVGETIIDKKVPVVVWRKGKEVTLQVLVGEFEKAEKEGLIPSEQVSPSKGTEVLGLTLQPITPWTRQQFQLPKDSSGVLIAKIDRYSEAYDKGVRTGDLIVEINYIEVFTPEDVRKNVSKLRKSGKKHTLVLINRCGSQHFITISLAERGSNKKMDNKDDGSD